MEVIILAGGLGTRLRSAIGNEIPKCMAPVADHPFLWYVMRYLMRMPVSRVILSVGHLREVIYRWVETIKDSLPFEIDYAVEEHPLGTGGGIKLALQMCKGSVAYVLNGDTYFDIDLPALGQMLVDNQALVALALKPMQDFDRYGAVSIDADGKVLSIDEKCFRHSGFINGGIYAIDVRRFSALGLPDKFSFEKDILERYCHIGTLYGMTADGYFIDIGIPSDFAKANAEFKTIFT